MFKKKLKPILFIDATAEIDDGAIKRLEKEGYVVVRILGNPKQSAHLVSQ